jgi:Seryl-tRNA synthetase
MNPITGTQLRLYNRLDSLFATWAKEWNAQEYRVPPFISVSELKKIDYFSSFPHLITFPATLRSESLQEFTQINQDEQKEIQITALNPIHEILTPAACYHFYILLQGSNLQQPLYLTTCANCFRNEKEYLPLQRQWSFHMREIVCIGSMEEVQSFLKNMRQKLEAYFASISLPVTWAEATDPFFNASSNPKFLSQVLDPVKTEMLYENQLAIGSINFHRNFFGESFHIQTNGNAAFSGCVAFGMERWMFAYLSTFGKDENSWPGI